MDHQRGLPADGSTAQGGEPVSLRNDCDLGSNGMPATPTALELEQSGHEGLVKAFLARTGVGRAAVRMIGEEDAQQQCRVGIVHAARTFDPGRGVRFTTHAWWRLTHSVQAVMRHHMAHPKLQSIDELKEDSTLAAELEDRWGGAQPWSPVIEAVRNWCDANDRKGAICSACWFDGLNMREAGRLFGVSRERVRQIIEWGKVEVSILLRRNVA